MGEARALIPQLHHCLVENFLVCLVSQVADESALLCTEQVSGTADVQVLHGDVDAAAQFAEVLEGLQSAACVRRQGGQWWRKQVAECLSVAASHTSTHLVEVAESEVMCRVDDDGVGVGNVDAVFHDGRREQHVVVVVREVEHYLLQLLGLHLSVAHSHAAVWHVLQYHVFQLPQIIDAVVDKEHLSVAAHLEVNGIGDDLCREGVYLRLYGVTVWRWSLYDAQVACADERELQRARYWRGTHRECVYVGLHLSQLLLCRDAELLFLVYNEQPQVLELHALANELVRANDDIYLSLCQFFQ